LSLATVSAFLYLSRIKEVMPQFNKLKVQTVVNETGDSVSVSFEVPDNLLVNCQFQPGQYAALRLNINGENGQPPAMRSAARPMRESL
jgi:ferredoxin-NADP reductase